MKRFIFLIWSLLYLGTSIGANVHLHYCMGKIAGWDLWQRDNKECDKFGMNTDRKKDGCCKEEYLYVKLKGDQKIVSYNVPDFCFYSTPNYTDNSIVHVPIQINSISYSSLNKLALRSWSIPLYVRNRLFLI